MKNQDPVPPVCTAATKRLESKKAQWYEVKQRVIEGTLRFMDAPRVPARISRLLQHPLIESVLTARGVAQELRDKASLTDLTPQAHRALERVINGQTFMPSWFLGRGAEISRTVGRVIAQTNSGKSAPGTGFLVGPRLLLTNAHVLDWSDINQESIAEIAPFSRLELDYAEEYNGQLQRPSTFRLAPETLLLTSPWHKLDYALVAVQPRSLDESTKLEQFSYNRLAGDAGKINKGEPVYIVQHPKGQPRQVVLHNNRLIDRDDPGFYLTYEADTDNGSSGSPVFNRQWEVVGLHHAQQFDRDESGRFIARDGSIWSPEKGIEQIRTLPLNEGVRISSILNDVARKLTEGAASLTRPEQISAEGLELLTIMLSTKSGAAPMDLIAPAPNLPPIPSRPAPDRFPRPD